MANGKVGWRSFLGDRDGPEVDDRKEEMSKSSSRANIQQGTFVEVRGKPWLVEALLGDESGLPTLSLSCISDDAQGEQLEVLWDAEIARRVLDEDRWSNVGVGRPDSADVLSAHIRAIRWRSP